MSEPALGDVRLNPEFARRFNTDPANIACFPHLDHKITQLLIAGGAKLSGWVEQPKQLTPALFNRRLYYLPNGLVRWALDCIDVEPLHNSPMLSIPIPFFVPAQQKAEAEVVVVSLTLAEIKKYNTAEHSVICVNCGTKLKNPYGTDPSFKHCPKCEP